MTSGVMFMLAMLLALALPALAQPLRFGADTPRVSLDGRQAHYADATGALSFETVSQPAFVRAHFRPLPEARSLGYDTRAHWFRVVLDPAAGAPERVVLTVGTPELEAVDVWVQQPDGGFREYAMGYHRPYGNRPLRTRLFALPTDVFPGMQLYIRVRTTNALNVHTTLWQVDAYTAYETRSNFYRGGYFGILLIAVTFYLILGGRLRDGVMLAYAGYVASQLLFHLGTNGYLPVLLGEESQWYTDALPRIGWLGGSMCIALMWDGLLRLKQRHPRIHRLFLFVVFFNLAFLPFALMPWLVGAWLLYAVKLANALNALVFFTGMGLLLLKWRQSRRGELMVYFVAFFIPMLGTAINSAMNLGLLSWNAATANFHQAATLVHVLVMSYGLALRLRQLQRDKADAEQDAALATRRAQEQRRFVAMLSHEFGNPLAAIDRAAQLLQLKLPELPPAEAQRLAQIRGNATTLAGFVDHFLMTEALDHGALALSRRPCAVREVLEGAMRAQGEAAQPRLRLLACVDGGFDLDPTLLGAALGNLLANALRYSPADSAVELRASRDARGLRIRVTDHGPGLSAEELEKLGTPYFRAASSLGKKGSGLGYHFTRRIVQAHGGTLTARSPRGSGLEVEIVLPE
ncbi:sensor histidine kinase [Thermomonas brevis]|uniref:histidine kinase n=1 Tax=Thermomonas brevis TaxID=215691 RepID=A0A7G9QT26_9GAMM|nr:sensor histidine kinase [Thermomonas brevis]QNN46501.1 sensor histidine kinase [Thermomonas brevis]